MPNRWTHILTHEELTAHFSSVARLDPSFAKNQREFYESRTNAQLHDLEDQAWSCHDPDSYQLARSYLAQAGDDA